MADGDREVLSSLPRTRPERRSAKRATRAPAAAKPKPRPKAKAAPRPKAAPRRVPPAGYAVPKTGSPVSSGSTELVGGAIQALGELANLGVSLGSRALRDALGRLPKP
jgi:hypothetical protein